jgi:hypothetical protein
LLGDDFEDFLGRLADGDGKKGDVFKNLNILANPKPFFACNPFTAPGGVGDSGRRHTELLRKRGQGDPKLP